MEDPTALIETKGFIGERYDDHAGLQYLNARYYDPKLGLFIQPDWFEVTEPGVGTNRYSYSFNDPVNLSDPTGNVVGNDVEPEDMVGSLSWRDENDVDNKVTGRGCGTATCHTSVAWLSDGRVVASRSTGSHPNYDAIANDQSYLEAHAQLDPVGAAIAGIATGLLTAEQAANIATTGTIEGDLPSQPGPGTKRIRAAVWKGVGPRPRFADLSDHASRHGAIVGMSRQ